MIVHVDAATDPRLEPYRHVGDHQWLREHGLFVAEGRFVLERLVAGRTHPIDSVLVTPAAFTALESILQQLDVPTYVAPQALLNETAGYNFHRGCLALAARPRPQSLDDVAPLAALLLGMERIGNPDNVGGLFRTAAAFGVNGIVLDDRSSDPYYRKSIRTSMGAVLTMPFATIEDWPAAIRALHDRGFEVLALTPSSNAIDVDALPARAVKARTLVLVGAEGSGLSDEVLSAGVVPVRIPMAQGVDSLNVVVAGGIALSRLRQSR
ncbi:MAG TPA: RNA methyltransferase [Vicinamibacterales bacterium]|nr:RNA methyltransferase [Vicinamibacterales bacterium]